MLFLMLLEFIFLSSVCDKIFRPKRTIHEETRLIAHEVLPTKVAVFREDTEGLLQSTGLAHSDLALVDKTNFTHFCALFVNHRARSIRSCVHVDHHLVYESLFAAIEKMLKFLEERSK